MDQDRQQLKELILDAERLMATARVEARALVSSAEIQATELVDAARQLHAAAESESETIRSQAAEVRAAAEHQAQHLLDEAQQKQTAALDAARSIASSEQGQAAAEPHTETLPADEMALVEASRRVDQMLRVARSEAKANADELIEQARRRAAQIDEDARRREEVAAKQHRALLLSMRDEQLAIRTRIAELRSELRAAEAAAHPHEFNDAAPSDSDLTGDERGDVPPVVEEGQRPVPDSPPVRSETMPMRPLIAQPLTTRQRVAHSAIEGETDDDYAKAVKRFRRRA